MLSPFLPDLPPVCSGRSPSTGPEQCSVIGRLAFRAVCALSGPMVGDALGSPLLDQLDEKRGPVIDEYHDGYGRIDTVDSFDDL